MAKFRLQMARQRGEQIAAEKGYTSFPVDPFEIATNEGILLEPKPADKKGVSGGIIFDEDYPSIFYATDINNEGLQRFTVAHELGHYFLDGHPEEILKSSKMHVSRAGFRAGDSSIELEADHFAAGLLMPTHLVRKTMAKQTVGLAGVEHLAAQSKCSLTAAAIRAAECSTYPMAIIVSEGTSVCYCFMSDGFKDLGKRPLHFLRKGSPLPQAATLRFNNDPNNVKFGKRIVDETTLAEWFDGSSHIRLDEEIVGLGSFGHTLTVLSSDHLAEEPDDEDDDEEKLVESYTPRFAYGR